MAQKDIAEKYLGNYNDVFSDIVNVLLFQGKQVVNPSELHDSTTRTVYKAAGKLREQERDISKYWEKGVRLALYGLENQTDEDFDMPLRIIGYDGASYRNQLDDHGTARYPVISLVLYFGEKPWKAPKSLYERLSVPDELKPFVNDYRIHVFDISALTQEQVQLFKSDFRVVADFFVQKRQNGNYKPSAKKLKHVDAVLKLLSIFTGDKRYESIVFNEKRGVSMCEVIEQYIQEGSLTLLYRQLKDNTITLPVAAQYANMTVEAFQDALKKLGLEL